jgi:hypothetical protein
MHLLPKLKFVVFLMAGALFWRLVHGWFSCLLGQLCMNSKSCANPLKKDKKVSSAVVNTVDSLIFQCHFDGAVADR